jgi:hypothetical protein
MRSRHLWVTLLAVVALALAAVAGVSAQTSQNIPAIVFFTSSVGEVTMADLEAGETPVTLSWHIINVASNQSVTVETWRQNGWTAAWDTREAILPVGSRQVLLTDTQSFAPPTFRISLVQGRNIVDQRYVTISVVENTGEPAIVSFETSSAPLVEADVRRGRARVEVSWEVENRPLNSQLVFTQVQSDGTEVNVELPRAVYYVPSTGIGAVQPQLPQQTGPVQLKLTLVNVITGEVYASSRLSVLFEGMAPPAETTAEPDMTAPEGTMEAVPPIAILTPEGPVVATPLPAVLPTSVPPTAPPAPLGPAIQLFTVTPTELPPGSSVNITWNVPDAVTVQISESMPDSMSGLTYVSLPVSGSVSIPLPDAATTTVTYTLTARDASGAESTATQTVTISG